jgi:hypothetical protein
VDGKVLRSKKKSDTWNETANAYYYPQTPSRIMLSLWPAGLPTNGQGTIEWAGGLIDWSSPYMQNGYYYAMVSDITVECYDPPSSAKGSGSASYIYTDQAGTEDTIEMSSKTVVLKSLYASGDNPDYNPEGDAKPSDVPESVPGVSGAGVRNDDQSNQNTSSGTTSGGSSGESDGTTSNQQGFSQGSSGSSGSDSSGSSQIKPERLGGSVLAILVAVGVAMIW